MIDQYTTVLREKETLKYFPHIPPVPLKWKVDPNFEMTWISICSKLKEQFQSDNAKSYRPNEFEKQIIQQRKTTAEEDYWMAGVIDNGVSLTISKTTDTKENGKWIYTYAKPEMRADESKYPARVIGLVRWGGSINNIQKYSKSKADKYPTWLWRCYSNNVADIVDKLGDKLILKSGMVPVLEEWAFGNSAEERLIAYDSYADYASKHEETTIDIPETIHPAYIAGWIDSSGTFSRTSKGNPLFILTSRNRNLTLYMKDKFGGSATGKSLNSGFASKGVEIIPHYNWQISGEPAKAFLDSIRSYLWIKKDHVDQMKII